MHAVDPMQVKANAEWLTQAEIFDKFLQFRKDHTTKWVTFSGGNPCIHDLQDLTTLLMNSEFKIAVETQGTFCPPWLWDTNIITVSPKGPGMGERFEQDKCDKFINEMSDHIGLNMKVVIFDQRDLEFASMLYERYCLNGPIEEDQFYLSLGNPYPPGSEAAADGANYPIQKKLLDRYETLLEDIIHDKLLCNVKFLPQWHVLLWGNKQGV